MPEARVSRRDLAGAPEACRRWPACPASPRLDALPGVPDAVFLGVNRHATVEAMRALAFDGRRRCRVLRIGLRRARGRQTCRASCSKRRATCRSSGRTATASSTRSTASRCGPTSTACIRFDRGVAIVSQSGNVARQPHVPAARAAARHDGHRRQPGQHRDGGLHRRVPRRPADQHDRAVPRSGARSCSTSAAWPDRAHAQGVPIVALHTGRSAAGAAIATSHTGSMSGRAAAYDALFARYGVATVRHAGRDVRDAETARQRRPADAARDSSR